MPHRAYLLVICLTSVVGFVVCPVMIRASAIYGEDELLNALNLIMLIVSSMDFVVSW